MDIGTKIKNARIKAQLTQEQVAEALGVSRQTVSNWENGKTYPDIVSVIKMSDLYSVTLDHLLKEKEETPMSGYINYLEESTNTVKSKNKLSVIIMLSTYIAVWAFALIVFWLLMSPTDAMGYSIMFMWIILPVTTFVLSLIIGKNNYFGKWKCILPVIFGVMHMLADYGTFRMANMIAFDKFNMPRFEMMLAGALISLIGLGIAVLSEYKIVKR